MSIVGQVSDNPQAADVNSTYLAAEDLKIAYYELLPSRNAALPGPAASPPHSCVKRRCSPFLKNYVPALASLGQFHYFWLITDPPRYDWIATINGIASEIIIAPATPERRKGFSKKKEACRLAFEFGSALEKVICSACRFHALKLIFSLRFI